MPIAMTKMTIKIPISYSVNQYVLLYIRDNFIDIPLFLYVYIFWCGREKKNYEKLIFILPTLKLIFRLVFFFKFYSYFFRIIEKKNYFLSQTHYNIYLW